MTEERLVPDAFCPGAFWVQMDGVSQSWVDPSDPLRIDFEYVKRIVEALEATVLTRPDDERIRVIHIGGGGLTIPRYVVHRRPHTAQIVLEPDSDLVAEVRRKIPLPTRSGIKIREVDGRTGIAAMPADYADCIILDAFIGVRVPPELATVEFFDDIKHRMRRGGVFIANISDKAPFAWAKRFIAGVRCYFRNVQVSAESATWNGRRIGNLVVVACDARLPHAELERTASRADFTYRTVYGKALQRWVDTAEGWNDSDQQSVVTVEDRVWFS